VNLGSRSRLCSARRAPFPPGADGCGHALDALDLRVGEMNGLGSGPLLLQIADIIDSDDVVARVADKVFVSGRLLRWPPFAKGSLSGSWTGFAALLAYRGYYRALAGGATIAEDRPVRPDFEKPYLLRLAAAGRFEQSTCWGPSQVLGSGRQSPLAGVYRSNRTPSILIKEQTSLKSLPLSH
jgi:hypothetical protein